MKCFNRFNFGIAIGVLNILLNLALIIFAVDSLVRIESSGAKRYEEINAKLATLFIVIIVVFSILTIFPGLLIIGIVKRRHNLMLPWLILSGFGFVFNCGRFIYGFSDALISGVSFSVVFIILLVAIVTIGMSFLIIRAIYNLYREIRHGNLGRPGAYGSA